MATDILYTQKNRTPTRKVTAAVVGGAPLAVVLVWLAGLVNINMPAEVAAALAVLVAGGIAWFVRDRVQR